MLIEINNPQHPPPRKIKQIKDALAKGVLIIADEASYRFVASIENKNATQRIYALKSISAKTPPSLLCHDFSQFSRFITGLPTDLFRLIKNHIPGNYTFVFHSSKEVPRYLLGPKKTVGIKVPKSNLVRQLAEALTVPIVTIGIQSDTLEQNGASLHQEYKKTVDLVVDSGTIHYNPSAIIDFSQTPPAVLRQGAEDLTWII